MFGSAWAPAPGPDESAPPRAPTSDSSATAWPFRVTCRNGRGLPISILALGDREAANDWFDHCVRIAPGRYNSVELTEAGVRLRRAVFA